MNASFPSPVPARAEALNIFDHIKSDRFPSKYAPGADCLRLSLICAACKADNGPVPFNEEIACSCGLHMWPAFSHLFVWRDDVLATVPAPAMAEG